MKKKRMTSFNSNLKNKSISFKRRLTIIEKIMVSACAFLTFPIGLAIASLVVIEVNPFDPGTFVQLIPAWFFVFLLITFVEFHFNNISINKGLLSTTFVSVLVSFVSYCSIIVFYVFFVSYPSAYFTLILWAFGFYSVFITFFRILLNLIDKKNKKICVIIGKKEEIQVFLKKTIKQHNKFIIKYLIYSDSGIISEKAEKRINYCNTIILLSSLSHDLKQKYLLLYQSSLNKDVYVATTYYDIVLVQNYKYIINDIMTFEQIPLRIDIVEAAIKRTVDIIISSIALILSFPIWLIVPLLIKLDDKGPVFYKQIRVTINLKEYEILKFRSMGIDAEADGALTATENDPRVTKVGKFLRATRIDEIPQLLNVLKGDMSLVGPRPFRPKFIKEYLKENPLYIYRFNVKAGITGYQQVSTPASTEYFEKLKYDLFYISHYSIIFDLTIMVDTIKVVFQKGMSEGIDTSNLTMIEFLNAHNITLISKEGYDKLEY